MELKDYREQLDQIDDQLAALFKQRMETVKNVADYKKEHNTPVLAAGREREILYRVTGLCGEELLGAYGGRIINIHPALLPAFKGAHAIRDAFEYGVKVYGVTIHGVDASLDGGPIIAQRAFAYEGRDLDELEAMVHAVEHPLYIETIGKLLKEE